MYVFSLFGLFEFFVCCCVVEDAELCVEVLEGVAGDFVYSCAIPSSSFSLLATESLLFSSTPLSRGNGGKATVRNCLLPLPDDSDIQLSTRGAFGVSGRPLLIPVLSLASLLDATTLAVTSPLPAPFSTKPGSAATEGVSKISLRSVRRRNPGSPRGCCDMLINSEAALWGDGDRLLDAG